MKENIIFTQDKGQKTMKKPKENVKVEKEAKQEVVKKAKKATQLDLPAMPKEEEKTSTPIDVMPVVSPIAMKNDDPIVQEIPIDEGNKQTEEKPMEGEKESWQIIDTIAFKKENSDIPLKLVLLKRNARMHRINVMLGERMEIKNATYTGRAMAFSIWETIKGLVNV